MHWADRYIGVGEGPTAVVRYCKVKGCKFALTRRKIRGAGRGAGFREGNKQRGEMIQHVKLVHPHLAPAELPKPSNYGKGPTVY